MENNIQKDERVVAEKRKIQSDGFQMILIFLLVSTLIQQYILKAPLAQYIVEFFCFVMGAFYVVFKNLFKGNFVSTKEYTFKRIVLMSLFNSLVISSVLYFVTGERDIKSSLMGFVVAFFVYMAMMYLFKIINKKRIEKLEKDLED